MKVIAINGSPRKNWNTHMLLSKALEGADAAGAETELVNLYDLDYKGCTSCLACKLRDSDNIGHCAVNDGLKPVLESIDKCDGLILGSPIYFGEVTGMMRAFLERLFFQYLSYDDYSKTYFTGNIKPAFIFTMNVSEDMLVQAGYQDKIEAYKMMLTRFFGSAESFVSTETLQVNDYSRYHMELFNEAERKVRRAETFPSECKKAYELGKSMANT